MEPCGPVQACNGIVFATYKVTFWEILSINWIEKHWQWYSAIEKYVPFSKTWLVHVARAHNIYTYTIRTLTWMDWGKPYKSYQVHSASNTEIWTRNPSEHGELRHTWTQCWLRYFETPKVPAERELSGDIDPGSSKWSLNLQGKCFFTKCLVARKGRSSCPFCSIQAECSSFSDFHTVGIVSMWTETGAGHAPASCNLYAFML